jgi:type VI secretion system secreted protein Hcp
MANVDYFLKIDGIEGESTDSKHSKEIELLSWGWSETNQGSMASSSGGGGGKVAMGDFSFSMHVNTASPKLMLACASGEHIKKATLTCRKAGKEQQEFLKIDFTDFLVSAYTTGGSPGETVPVEQISFNFTQIEIKYKAQKADGSLGGEIPAGWNLKTNAKV